MSTTTASHTPVHTSTARPIWLPGLGYAAVAAAATAAIAAGAHAVGVSLEIDGEMIPLLGFAQLTFVCGVIGLVIATSLRRWARTPARTFVRATVALTVVSFLPDLLTPDIDLATRLTLMATHVVAAAIVIPKVAARLR